MVSWEALFMQIDLYLVLSIDLEELDVLADLFS